MTARSTFVTSAKLGGAAIGGLFVGAIAYSAALGIAQGILDSIGAGISLSPLIPGGIIVAVLVAGYFVSGMRGD